MSFPSSYFVPGKTTAVASIAAAGHSAEIPVGNGVLVRIFSNQQVNVRFGPSGTNVATAADLPIASNVEATYDMGLQYQSICIYNNSGSAALVWVTVLSRN